MIKGRREGRTRKGQSNVGGLCFQVWIDDFHGNGPAMLGVGL